MIHIIILKKLNLQLNFNILNTIDGQKRASKLKGVLQLRCNHNLIIENFLSMHVH